MILFHSRLRRNASLLAAGALDGGERAEALGHLRRCPSCQSLYEDTRAVVSALEADPLRSSEPELPLSALLARVERAIDRSPSESGREASLGERGRRFRLVAVSAAAALVAAAVFLPAVLDRARGPGPAPAATPWAEAPVLASEDALQRIERNLVREQAARYLAQAGEVLVTVAASGIDCDRTDGRLDVGGAPERSRELLERRRLVVEGGGEALASAAGVLDEVEMALRDVALLPSCVRRRDVERLRREVEQRQLLMRIRLMTRELEG